MITIDARTLSPPTVTLSGTGTFPSAAVQHLALAPGTYSLTYNAGVSQPSVPFTVTSSGLVDYPTQLDGVLGGRGSTALTVIGRSIRIDASALSMPTFDVNYVLDDEPTAVVATLTLLRGDHAVLYNAGVSQPSITFAVTIGGTVDYASGLDGVLAGRGSAILQVKGRTVQVDATALGISTFTLAFNGDFSATSLQDLTLVPGAHLFAAGGRSFDFAVTGEGSFDYDSIVYPYLAGLGTLLIIQ